ncbi:hypothetical protein DPEC_G00368160 [Dallia pectoralis]|nr:hypothetical protein DPEC_G00368160 [Dallia pectoralis]
MQPSHLLSSDFLVAGSGTRSHRYAPLGLCRRDDAAENSMHIEGRRAVQKLQGPCSTRPCRITGGPAHRGPAAGKLLMTLPLLRQTSTKAVQHFYSIKQDGKVPMHKLCLELLEAKV